LSIALDAVTIALFVTIVIALAALTIALFVARHLVAITIAQVVTVTIAHLPPSLP
jgi:hypothetical protein